MVTRPPWPGASRSAIAAQLADGFLAEVAALAAGPSSCPAPRARPSATRSCSATSTVECSLDEALATAIARTRRFAVRQERWFRRDPRIRWVPIDR